MKQITQGTMYRLLLRANIEAFYNNCRFIFTCNYKNKIIEPLHSRCAVVDFATTSKDRPRIAASFFKRLQQILDAEGVEFDNKVLVELVNKHFPDFERVLNECQRYSVGGSIDSAILASFSDVSVNELINHLKDKNYPEVESGSLIIWTMILIWFFVVFTMLLRVPWMVLLLLLLFLLLLSINTKLPS